jgi:hypothetical protein
VSGSERKGGLLVWGALGLGFGVVAGFALAEAVGMVDRKRVGRALDRLTADPLPAPLPSGKAARRVVVALARFPDLAETELEVRGLAPGRVELRGWVADRRTRALAERTAAAVTGITTVVNRLLVQDEDDTPAGDGRGYTGLSLVEEPA